MVTANPPADCVVIGVVSTHQPWVVSSPATRTYQFPLLLVSIDFSCSLQHQLDVSGCVQLNLRHQSSLGQVVTIENQMAIFTHKHYTVPAS